MFLYTIYSVAVQRKNDHRERNNVTRKPSPARNSSVRVAVKDGAFSTPLANRVLSAEQFYEKIQQAIFEHRLKPGTQLIEGRLVEISGMSRARIRPILARLAHENLVTLIPNRGAFIASPSIEEAREIFFTRRLIEPAISTILCKIATPAQIKKLRQHVQHEAKAREQADRSAIIRLSGEFHTLLAALAGNRL